MDVSDEAMKQVFARLRPICVLLTQDPSRNKIHTLTTLLDDVTDGQLALLQDYVLFPLRIIIKSAGNRNIELCTDSLTCLHQVLRRCPVTRVDAFQDVFNSLCILISGPEARVSDVPEELKLAAVECLSALVSGAPLSVRCSLYQLPFLPSLGHAVSLLLALVTDEMFRKLQKAAAQCLLHILSTDIEDKEVCRKAANTISSFLPGITIAMTKVITGDVKQGHGVTTVALEVWTETVALVMGDESLGMNEPSSDKDTASDSGIPQEMATKLADLKVTRSEDWVKSTADRLQIMVDRIATVVTHPSWKMRLSLVNWAHRLIICCSRSMPSASPVALDILVQLSDDEYDSVSNHSQGALQCVRVLMDADGSQKLTVVLEENLHELATRLPRLMHSADDEKKLSTLILFSGYLKLLGCRVRGLLLSASHLHRVSMALVQVLDFDTSHIELVQEAHTGFQLAIGSSRWTGASPRFYFKHFTDEAIHKQIIYVCRILGCYGDLNLLVDHFLEIAHQGLMYRKQAFYIINHLLLGVKDNQQTTTETGIIEDVPLIIESLLEEYLSPDNWDLDTEVHSDPVTRSKISTDWQIVSTNQRPHTLVERTGNILQICILLEGISNMSQVLGCRFKRHLVDVIYPLMERLGDNMAAINSTAQRVTQYVATACGYRDVHEMVCANSDYLVNAISLRLRHIERYPKSPCVLQSVLKHSTSTVLPLFEDIVQEVLLVLDDHYDTRAAIFMQVLYTLTAAIVIWYPHHKQQATEEEDGPSPAKITKMSETDSNATTTSKPNNEDSLVEFLLNYDKLKKEAEGEMDADDSGMDSRDMTSEEVEDEIGGDEEKKVISQHIEVVKQILERCCHLLSSPDPRLRLFVLRTLSEGCVAMQSEQNELLPMAHKLWAPFVRRFQDDEQVVALQAVQVLETLGQTTGDFLTRRVVTEVLPPMADFLTKQAKLSARVGTQYRFTMLSKLQVAVIETMSSISTQVQLSGCLLYRVARSCLHYLSIRQPKHLQQVALAAFGKFMAADPDTIWLLLIEQYCPVPLKPLDHRYSNHKVGSSKKNEFSENIQKLIVQLET